MIEHKKVIINVSNVNQSFEVGDERLRVLKDVTFMFKEKTFNIIYGQSGSGKSTLLNVIAGLQKPSTGNVLFLGRSVYDLTPDQLAHLRANEIGMVYQQNFWVKSLNVIENVSMPLFFSGCSRHISRQVALESLEKVGMADYADKYPTMMSGGEQQRVAMARALVNNPRFIIADEPTGNLDSTNGDMIMSLLQQCKNDFGQTIVLVTHNMEYIPLADHLLNIKDGAVVETTDDTNITKIADSLISDMKHRIDHLSKAKNHARTK